MTVKELKEELEQFPDDLLVMMINPNISTWFVPVANITRGVNEADGCMLIDSYYDD